MRTGGTTHVDPGDLQAWFSQARPGDTLIYAIGSISADRSGFGDSLHLVAQQALQRQSTGHVFLFQRRIPRDGVACSNIAS